MEYYEKEKPLVSVVIPVYNRESLVIGTLDSVVNQIHRPLQVVIIDDGSQDKTYELINKWRCGKEDSLLSIDVFSQSNSGAPSARNFGIKRSNGKYIQFLDSDDFLSPEKISTQVKALEESGNDIAVCDFQYIYKGKGVVRVVENNGDLIKKITHGWSISIFTPLIRKESFFERVWWSKSLKRQQDIDFLFKVFCFCNRFLYTPGVMCDYVHHDQLQISDQYKVKSPQFFRRVFGLAIFWYKNLSILPSRSHLMIAKNILYIFRSFFVFWLKKMFKICLREYRARKLYGFMKK